LLQPLPAVKRLA